MKRGYRAEERKKRNLLVQQPYLTPNVATTYLISLYPVHLYNVNISNSICCSERRSLWGSLSAHPTLPCGNNKIPVFQKTLVLCAVHGGSAEMRRAVKAAKAPYLCCACAGGECWRTSLALLRLVLHYLAWLSGRKQHLGAMKVSLVGLASSSYYGHYSRDNVFFVWWTVCLQTWCIHRWCSWIENTPLSFHFNQPAPWALSSSRAALKWKAEREPVAVLA